MDLTAVAPSGIAESVRNRPLREGLLLRATDVPTALAPVFAARYDNGVWVRLPDGSYRNARPAQMPEAVDSLSSLKYAKALAGPGHPASAYTRPLGHVLELVPVTDPFVLAPGDILRVRVLLDGKPAAGARVELGDGVTPQREEDIVKFPADAQGVVSLPLTRTGWHVLAVDVDRPSRAPEPTRIEKLVATRTFWLP